ncbi:hypothetical protein LTS14_003575 [Recurvomyces mirabilis]|uniref:uncharacterized protein n=1 Tax=Recurvomyces mirabilis TaxID=574656 RepID=UPI002DE1BD41|nr:hypothetical protein LTS14_003575 [Recurvomyces mirabilis]
MAMTPKAAKTSVTGTSNNTRPSTNRTPTASSNTSAPSHSPSRMSAAAAAAAAPQQPAAASNGTAAASTSASAVDRTRSVRNGAPVSARAAAAARKSQADLDPTASDLKAETQLKMDELAERLQAADQALTDSQKQASVLRMKLDDALREQGMLEEHVHEHTERIEELEVERKESLRAKREFEQIYEDERVAAMREKEEAGRRADEMQSSIQRMKENMAQREMRAGLVDEERRPGVSRSSSFRSNTASPNPDSGGPVAHFAPPTSSSSLQRSDSQSRSRLVNQKDKIIEGLRLELAEVQIKLVEVENMGGGRMQQLQKEMYEIKMQNARLMEENESFQLLLTEKTMSGDFLHRSAETSSRPPSRNPADRNGGAAARPSTLADELASEADSMEGGDGVNTTDQSRRLQVEVNSLKDQNKALTLYINNIISRLLMSDQFEQILDKTPDMLSGAPGIGASSAVTSTSGPTTRGMGLTADPRQKELPPPPPPAHVAAASEGEDTIEDQPQGFLQRARSVMGGRRGRPMSQAVSASDQEKLAQQLQVAEARPTENPETAPRVPLNRANSTRGGGGGGAGAGGGGHRRTNSDWPAAAAAGVVTNMYRGPSPGSLPPQGPVSPGLGSPTHARNSFFANATPLGVRVGSGSGGGPVPTISETGVQAGKENQVPPPTAARNRSSVISNHGGNGNLDPNDIPTDLDAPTSNPSSPPRSTTSSGGEKDSRTGGSVMMGSKPRPLRLVQNASAEDEAKKAGNRNSWFGWMGKGVGVGSPPVASQQQQQPMGLGSVGRSVSGSGQQGEGGGQ